MSLWATVNWQKIPAVSARLSIQSALNRVRGGSAYCCCRVELVVKRTEDEGLRWLEWLWRTLNRATVSDRVDSHLSCVVCFDWSVCSEVGADPTAAADTGWETIGAVASWGKAARDRRTSLYKLCQSEWQSQGRLEGNVTLVTCRQTRPADTLFTLKPV